MNMNTLENDQTSMCAPCYSGGRKLMSAAKKAEIREGLAENTDDWQKNIKNTSTSKRVKKLYCEQNEQKPKIQKRCQIVKALGKNRRSASLNKLGHTNSLRKINKVSIR